MWERLFTFGLKNEIRFWFIRTFKTRKCIKPQKDWVFTSTFDTDERSDNND